MSFRSDYWSEPKTSTLPYRNTTAIPARMTAGSHDQSPNHAPAAALAMQSAKKPTTSFKVLLRGSLAFVSKADFATAYSEEIVYGETKARGIVWHGLRRTF